MDSSRKMFVWGANEDNQLGQVVGESKLVSVPQLVSTQKWGDLVRVSCGYKHTLLLNRDGEVFSAGANEFGQLGRNKSENFEMIQALKDHTIVDITCGAYHNAAISYTGRLYTWGCNSNGQLGREGDDPSVKMVRSLAEHRVVQASLGLEHSLVLTETSDVYVFGANIWGQLGLGFRSEEPTPVPQKLTCLAGLPIRCIAAGGHHSAVLTMSGSVFTWGANKNGQLGLGPVASVGPGSSDGHGGRSSIEGAQKHCVSVPTLVRGLKGMEVVHLACGEAHSVVLRRDGSIYSFGGNQFGQLGQGESTKYIPLPCQVSDLSGSTVTQIACGRMHTVVLTPQSGRIYAFGAGYDGQLGNEDLADSMVPKLVQGPWVSSTSVQGACPTNSNFVGSFVVMQLYCGGDHTCALVQKAPLKSAEKVDDHREWNPTSTRAIGTLCAEYIAQLRNEHSALPLPAPMCRSDSISSTTYSSSRNMSMLSTVDSSDVRNTTATFSRIEAVFSSSACLAASCLSERHFKTGRDEHGVDLDGARNLQHELFQLLNLKQLHRLICKLLTCFQNFARTNYPAVECLRYFMVLLVSDLLNVPRRCRPGATFSVSSTASNRSGGSSLGGADTSGGGVGSPSTYTMDASDEGPYLTVKDAPLNADVFLHELAKAIIKLEPAPFKIFGRWLRKVQPRYLKKLVVDIGTPYLLKGVSDKFIPIIKSAHMSSRSRVQAYDVLSSEFTTRSGNLNNMVAYLLDISTPSDVHRPVVEERQRNALELMKHLYNINQTLQQPISYKSFCVPEIKEKINLEAVFYNWITHNRGGAMRFFSYCDYPFVFDAPTKARMLNMEARLSMVAATDRAQQNTILDWLIHRQFSAVSPDSPYLKLTVRRDKLIQDTLTCLAIAKPSDFRKLLRVEFDGEEAVDEGGVLKEFFLLIMRDLLSPIYGMFRCYPESRMLWFNESTMESENVFQLIGILCGLAIYNSVIVDLSFPLGMFRKLLGEKPELDDLKELDPVVGRSLQQLLDYEEADFTDVFCSLTFSLDIDFFGANRHIDLIENGANIPVNQENKALYVEKYVDYVFNRSCERPYKAFEGGFMQVCSGDVIHFFRPMELQSLVVGLEVINWNELRENTAYQGVYWDHHPVIEWFWTVLLIEFSIEDKKKFLRFLTGCDRVPIVGFSSLKITIQPNNSGDDYLPVAHTCANLLDLPLYSSKEILARKLALAIQQTEGFGLV